MYKLQFIIGCMHAVQAPVFKLPRGPFWGYSPHRSDTLHRWCEIWHGAPWLTPAQL